MDLQILLWIQTLHNGFLDTFFIIYTHLGDWGVLWFMILGFFLLHKSTRKMAFFGILCFVTEVLLVEGILKPLVMRPRPFEVLPIAALIPSPNGSSFPSGHAAGAFAVAVYLYLWKVPYRSVYVVLAFLMAFSRLYVFVHYPSDVLVGMVIGSLLAVIFYRISKYRIGNIL